MPQATINRRARELNVYINRDDVSKFVHLVKDTNPIHTNKRIAIAKGFSDTPIPGTMLHAYFEQLVLVCGFDPSAYSLKFIDFSYPGDILRFRVKNQSENGLELECLNSEGIVVASCNSSKLRTSPDVETTGSSEAFYDYEISKQRRNLFYSHLGVEPNERVPVSLVSAFVPASLLNFLSEQQGDHEGVYRRIDFILHQTPEIGDLRVGLYFKGQRRIKDKFIYNVGGECSQDGKRVLSAKLHIITSFDFKTLS